MEATLQEAPSVFPLSRAKPHTFPEAAHENGCWYFRRNLSNTHRTNFRYTHKYTTWPTSCTNPSFFVVRAHREASELRQLLAKGVAPEPPKFWSAKPGHPDVGSTQDDDALTEELLLCWRPQHGSAVRMFIAIIGRGGGRGRGDPACEDTILIPQKTESFNRTLAGGSLIVYRKAVGVFFTCLGQRHPLTYLCA